MLYAKYVRYKNISDHNLVEEYPDWAVVGRGKKTVRERIGRGQRDKKKLHGERPLLSSVLQGK